MNPIVRKVIGALWVALGAALITWHYIERDHGIFTGLASIGVGIGIFVRKERPEVSFRRRVISAAIVVAILIAGALIAWWPSR